MAEGSVEGWSVEGSVDPDEVAEELYGLPRDEFVPRRNEVAKQARAAGDRDAAAAIADLRKPSVAAWLANALAREYPDEVGGLEELGSSLREAQQRLEGDALRALSRQRHELIAALVTRARRLAREDGVHVGETVVRELERTVSAALSDAAAARAFAAGRLTGTLEPGSGLGDAPTDDAGAAATVKVAVPASRARTRRPSGQGGRQQAEQVERERAERERAERQRAVEAAEEEVQHARRRAEEARDAAEAAEQERAAAAEQVEDLRARLSAAEAEQQRAEDRAATATAAREDRDRELDTADAELDETRRRLDEP